SVSKLGGACALFAVISGCGGGSQPTGDPGNGGGGGSAVGGAGGRRGTGGVTASGGVMGVAGGGGSRTDADPPEDAGAGGNSGRGGTAGAGVGGSTATSDGAAGAGGDAGQTPADGGAPLGTPTVADFHLTARPWTPLNFPRERYLKNVEGVVRAMMKHQDASGAIIDPVEKVEFQYGTPFFIYAGATLLDAGRAADILPAIVKAMDHTAGDIGACATGNHASIIPQDHGNFFVAPLASAYTLLKSKVPAATAERWKAQLSTPIDRIINPLTNNWKNYAMKGEWLRAQAGLVSAAQANAFVDYSWTGSAPGKPNIESQLSRIHDANLQFYHDTTANPETYAYEVVSRMNIEAILAAGYEGPSKAAMETFVVKGGETAIKTLDPTGQGAANGRSGDHSWNDVVPLNAHERLANRYKLRGDEERAGRYRRAAMLGLRSIDRWLRPDGSYSTTKNQFDYNLRVHYADYSGRTQYNGNMQYHQAEAYYLHRDDITEWPTWSEIGGYAFQTDDQFAGAFVNAGGMHLQIALRGQTSPAFGIYWTALGVSRLSRVDWDSRLGPSDGIRDERTGVGLSFAPTFLRGNAWTRLATIPNVYRAHFSASFVHPLLVRFALDYRPLAGQTGPTFHQDFVVTPDGVLTTLTSTAPAGEWGISWPLLNDDGAGPLVVKVGDKLASTRFAAGTDEQNFIAVGGDATLTMEGVVRSGYGDLRSVRYVAAAPAVNQTFVYPRNAGAPEAAAVRDSFMATANGFKTVLGRVEGSTYVGATSAGGESTSLDIDGDGTADVTFDQICKFVLQLDKGRILAVEADRAVSFKRGAAAPVALKPYVPVRF
ncbi:MAG TPA: hypothetical protein VGG33_18030, partial [Polyangia bacterium]